MSDFVPINVKQETYREVRRLAKDKAEELGLSTLSQAKFVEYLLQFYKDNSKLTTHER